MRKYLLPKDGTFYKANLHMHTTISDGNMTPEETKEKFMDKGYSIVAFTDHEIMVPHPELCDEKFLAITSTEIAIDEDPQIDMGFRKVYHLNIYSKDPNRTFFHSFDSNNIWLEHSFNYIDDSIKNITYKRKYNVDDVNYIIKKAKEENCLVSYNHPFWSLQEYKDYIDLKGVWGVEWHNTGCVRNGYMDTIQPVDDLLRNGENVFPLATDDAHSIYDCFGGFVMVKADKLNYNLVMDALEKGDFYSSNKTLIEELYFENGIVYIKTSPARKIFISTESRHTFTKTCSNDELLTYAEFDIKHYLNRFKDRDYSRAYIRVTVIDEEGYLAYTRAYFVKELI